jgi:large subunit ribosomal protein L37Ae
MTASAVHNMAEKHAKAYKRFGPRYGRTLKDRLSYIEQDQKKTYKCPYCNYSDVKRASKGIWECRKCKAKFTGKAYTFDQKVMAKSKQ